MNFVRYSHTSKGGTMIKLRSARLPSTVKQQLASYQRQIDALPSYVARVYAAKDKFEQYNKPNNSTFKQVRQTLEKMCAGIRHCCYCEDSVADEVEHIYPKDLYPEKVFVWSNYAYACGQCNGPKGNHFALISPKGVLTDIARSRNDPVTPPPKGKAALLNPRTEDAFDFLELDLVNTFYFHVIDGLSLKDAQRAKYTLDILRLNKRDYLVKRRRRAYQSYRNDLEAYIQHRDNHESPQLLKMRIAQLRMLGHPTVWREMKRQYQDIPELKALFDNAPEALQW